MQMAVTVFIIVAGVLAFCGAAVAGVMWALDAWDTGTWAVCTFAFATVPMMIVGGGIAYSMGRDREARDREDPTC